ncbi:response regulator transcription factor [Nocardioides bizhenqiangii]|uniref:Response regulator transcription factor n=1 Tax=Nocardioides bizhenqiangii TaxID=3095076 RepID=A0ABZ0ZWC8_9ACTN|nr:MULTISPECIES: response regulator transcription factor [unclassified Nocardioides]MDZ5623278.1 response regulator transcription factor [Nocardioides sp. HM23]WQQ28249.1 response regulator transcription factor [Nocardioides sp. HM61]
MITVLVADDQALVRDGLRLILDSQADIEVVEEAADGDEAVRAATRLTPDVVLMDIRMPGVDGLEATSRITSRTGCRVLVLTTFDLDEYVVEALRAGASGFLLKSSPRQHLLHAVRTVCEGGALLDPRLTVRLVEEHVLGRTVADPTAQQQLGRLTAREREVLALLARGFSNTEIAARLHLGETTVKSHVAHTLAKIEARDRIQAVVFAYEAGFVRAGEPPGIS